MNKLIRSCPNCQKILIYKSQRCFDGAQKNNTLCKKCGHVDYDKTGSNNPMYGKSVYDVWLKKYGKEEADKRRQLDNNKKSKSSKIAQNQPELKKAQSQRNSGSNNPMYGKSVYDVWLKKYGKEEADKRLIQLKKKHSLRSSGSDNPMYGKPSPQGSGNGWSGWYKGFYFRSLLELSYLKYLFDHEIKFRTAETQEFKVEYKDWDGKIRNYFPDFYLEDTQEIIEIKPKKLINTKQNKNKFKAAKRKYGNKFKIITEEIKITDDEIKKLYDNKKIKWTTNYETKFNNY